MRLSIGILLIAAGAIGGYLVLTGKFPPSGTVPLPSIPGVKPPDASSTATTGAATTVFGTTTVQQGNDLTASGGGFHGGIR